MTNITPSNPIRLAQMMRLAQMARVEGVLYVFVSTDLIETVPAGFDPNNGAFHLGIV